MSDVTGRRFRGAGALGDRTFPISLTSWCTSSVRFRIDGVMHKVSAGKLELGPGRTRLEFLFHGLSFSSPEKVSYRTRLVGFEDSWRDVGNQRLTTYDSVPPGSYHFEVLAMNGDGLQSPKMAMIDVAGGDVTKIGEPAMIRSVSTAPGEELFRVATVKKPFSYYVPFQRFGATEGIWDRAGKSLHTMSDRNLRETEPTPAVAVKTTTPGPKAGGQPTAKGALAQSPFDAGQTSGADDDASVADAAASDDASTDTDAQSIGANGCEGDRWDHDGDPSTDCVARTRCAAGEYALPLTAGADRRCAGCAAGSFCTTRAVKPSSSM